MHSFIQKLRKWLNPESNKDSETDILIKDFLAILTNSNPHVLERLLKLNAAAKREQEEHKVSRKNENKKIDEPVVEEIPGDPDTMKALEPIISDMEKLEIDPKSDDTRPLSGRDRYLQFKAQSIQHISLMRELEQEAILPGVPCYQPPKSDPKYGKKFYLPKYSVPQFIYEAFNTNKFNLLRVSQPITEKNYRHNFDTLLWVEEMHQAIELRRYDMENVMLNKYQSFYVVPVPGLAEGRPSLMRGDKLILKPNQTLNCGKRKSLYEGIIHDVRSKDVLIKLHSSLHLKDLHGLRFGIRFMSSRTCFRRCHHGVRQYVNKPEIKKILFPQKDNSKMKKPMIDIKELTPDKLRCFLRSLNIHQRKAVIGILQAQSRPAPYIIFGPPGTGKTVTLVEAILQVYCHMPTSRILVCGNSNSCADVLAKRILDSKVLPQRKIIRLSAFYRMQKLIPPGLETITHDVDSISEKMYDESRIIITTCMQSGALHNFNARFGYLFLDEAGHACEPEALIPLSLLDLDGCMVLAGDPHQLGPVVMSPVATKLGLDVSFLERLSKLDVYKRKEDVELDGDAYDGRYITKLLISYRCDPRVLKVNNALFYNNELEFTQETPKHWLNLLKLTNPLAFHPIKGKDRREFINPSWFNPQEAIQCLTYVKRLYAGGLKASQLGIITPYRRQIHKLNLLFDGCNLERCKIATMEEFQGDEREVIIITTVRTRKANMAKDKKFNLGFLFNEKRFNVGISRAMWLVLVIGDPDVLKADTCWSRYIDAAQVVGSGAEKKKDNNNSDSKENKNKNKNKNRNKY